MVRLACLAAVVAAVLAPAAQAAGLPATVKALDRQMNRAGTGSGAYVVDLDTAPRCTPGRPTWRASRRR